VHTTGKAVPRCLLPQDSSIVRFFDRKASHTSSHAQQAPLAACPLCPSQALHLGPPYDSTFTHWVTPPPSPTPGMQGYYSVHGPNAAFIARQFFRTTAVVRGGDGPGALPYVNVNRSMFETVLRELLLNSTAHSVELYEAAGTGWKLAR
jgi:hypothetical protein